MPLFLFFVFPRSVSCVIPLVSLRDAQHGGPGGRRVCLCVREPVGVRAPEATSIDDGLVDVPDGESRRWALACRSFSSCLFRLARVLAPQKPSLLSCMFPGQLLIGCRLTL